MKDQGRSRISEDGIIILFTVVLYLGAGIWLAGQDIVYPDAMPVESDTLNTARLIEAYDRGHAQGMRDLPIWREFLFGSADAGPHPDPSTIQAQVREADGDDGYIVIEP